MWTSAASISPDHLQTNQESVPVIPSCRRGFNSSGRQLDQSISGLVCWNPVVWSFTAPFQPELAPVESTNALLKKNKFTALNLYRPIQLTLSIMEILKRYIGTHQVACWTYTRLPALCVGNVIMYMLKKELFSYTSNFTFLIFDNFSSTFQLNG